MKFQSLIGLTILSASAFAPAQLVEAPEALKRPPAPEERSDGPIPARPEFARPLTPEQIRANEEQFARFTDREQLEHDSNTRLAAVMKDADAVSDQIEAFRAGHNLAPAAGDTPKAAAKPIEIEVKPTDTVITAEEGMYFDLQEKNMVVYFKNVRLRSPDHHLDCTDQLQVYLQEDAEKKQQSEEKKKAAAQQQNGDAAKDEKTPFDNMNLHFKGIDRAVAYGNVVIRYKNKDGEWYEGHAERVTYNGVTGEIIMSGGYPYVRDGKNIIQMQKESATIRHYNGQTYFNGPFRQHSDDVRGQSELRKSKK